MYQDDDYSRAYNVFSRGLYPTHPLGRDVIGYPEDLKNPSMVNILKFKDTWYVPNNMVICLSGDLDPEKTIQLIDEAFGGLEPKDLPELPVITEKPISEPVIKEIYGPDAEGLFLGYRCGGEHSSDRIYIDLISNILYNGQAGLMDIDLLQEQEILDGYCYSSFHTDYGELIFNIRPKSDQTLEETKELVLAEIEKIKQGDSPDWMLEAITNQNRLSLLRRFEDNWRAFDFLDAFIMKKEWEDAKLNQNTILWSGLRNYARYGKISPFTDIIPNEDLFKVDPDELTALNRTLGTYPHRILYYGPGEADKVESIVRRIHSLPEALNPLPEAKKYPELDIDRNYVLLADYDISQVNFIMLSKGAPFSEEVYLESQLFNQYFGNSMASIVFQEVREAREMAYSAYAGYQSPTRAENSFYIFGFVGTQVDKLGMASSTMNEILNNLIKNQNSLDIARRAIQNTIATERITRTDLFFRWLGYQDLGFDHDIRQDIYERMETASMDDLSNFFDTHIKEKPYAYLVVGNVNDIDMNVLTQVVSRNVYCEA